jgi:aspartokinase/homoserine dehydrogenase 1
VSTRVLVLGAGAVGRELLTQLASRRGASAELSVCGVIDRSGVVFDANGLSGDAIADLCSHKARGGSLATARRGRTAGPAESMDIVTASGLDDAIVVDATAADTSGLLQTALANGFDAVLANKIPLSARQADVDRLYATAHRHRRRILYEATVGAGLPVIDTLRKLLDSGDEVLSVEGCPSGTLGFLFGELQRGRCFSDALGDAIAAGYTEPDPRVDLSGLDVARKALILGRQIGFRGEIEDVSVESLVPAEFRECSRDEFVRRTPELNEAFDERVRRATDARRLLRYRAHVTSTQISVGIAEVAASDPLGSLSGTDNQFTFTTARYGDRKLVITGPGAGTRVTASGIQSDLLRIVAEGRRPAGPPRRRSALPDLRKPPGE